MADYHTPTVVRPSIPANAITRLDQALLTGMFEHQADGDAIYFYSSEGPSETVWLDIAELRAMLNEEVGAADSVVTMVRARLAEAGPDETQLELDLSDFGKAGILQRIVRRCEQLDLVTITAAWTCSRMCPDGFGGSVTIVTADHILSSSTADMECRLLDQANYGDLACAPGHGRHPVLMLGEGDVRQMVTDIQHASAGADLGAVAVSDEHVRRACQDLIADLDFDERRRNMAFNAALAAIRIARDMPD